MFKRVLIANRGEIALRVLRACRELDIETVAVYSTADREALPVQLATRSVCIGPPRAADSYLNQDAILTAARAAGCDAVHPGYGLLSENARFADACAENGITFIGPSGDVIRAMGNKAAARALMRKAGVPVVPFALKTDFLGNGKRFRDFGPVRPEREVWFEFGAARKVEGNGQALQQEIIEFIGTRLAQWRRREEKSI